MLLLELVHTHREELLTGIETGQWPAERPLPPNVADTMKRRLRPNQDRAVELRALFATRDRLMISDIWSHVALMATWTGGNCRIPLQAITAQLPERAVTMDLGLLASECRTTLAVEANTRSGLPIFKDYFFEFVERACGTTSNLYSCDLGPTEQENEYYLFVSDHGRALSL